MMTWHKFSSINWIKKYAYNSTFVNSAAFIIYKHNKSYVKIFLHKKECNMDVYWSYSKIRMFINIHPTLTFFHFH